MSTAPPPLPIITIEEAFVAMLANRHVPPDRRAVVPATAAVAAASAEVLSYSLLSTQLGAARPSRALWPERTPRCGFPDELPMRC